MAKFYLLELGPDSPVTECLNDSTFHLFHSGVALHDSPVAALDWRICDSATMEKIESGNLPKVLRTSGSVHVIEGYYRAQTPVKQLTGEIEVFVNYYAVCERRTK